MGICADLRVSSVLLCNRVPVQRVRGPGVHPPRKPLPIGTRRRSLMMKPLVLALALVAAPAAAAPRSETAVLAGGCFWGMEAVFEHVKGVTDVVSGYAGGSKQDA